MWGSGRRKLNKQVGGNSIIPAGIPAGEVGEYIEVYVPVASGVACAGSVVYTPFMSPITLGSGLWSITGRLNVEIGPTTTLNAWASMLNITSPDWVGDWPAPGDTVRLGSGLTPAATVNVALQLPPLTLYGNGPIVLTPHGLCAYAGIAPKLSGHISITRMAGD